MNKEQKTAVVEELTTELNDADSIFAIDYRGISVPQAAELRTGLRDADTRFRVVKNRLTLLAADAAGTEPLKEHLEGPTALAFVKGDAALAAKTIYRLGAEWELLGYKGGLMDGEVLEADSFKEIARLPGREQMNAQFAGIVASPLTGLVRGLGSMVQGLASQLQQIADQGLVSGEAPPAEDEAPAAEEGDPDPEPSESPEEEPSEEKAPEGEEGGAETQVPETGEGDAEPGEAQEGATDGGGDETSNDKTSEDSDDDNEEDGK